MQPHFAHLCLGSGMIFFFWVFFRLVHGGCFLTKELVPKLDTLSEQQTQVIPPFPLLTPLLAQCLAALCSLTLLII